MLFVITGLGNPGKKYSQTRHNIGFRVLDRLAERYDISLDRKRFSALTGTGSIGERRVLLVKPMTYMNSSGEAIGSAGRFFKVPFDRIVVVHDDIDLCLGRIQIRRGGGHGGHRGLRSVLEALGDGDFVRLRVGVNHPILADEVTDYVLDEFGPEERSVAKDVIERAVEALVTWLEDGLLVAMNRFNPWKASEVEN